ncbi:MAG: LysR substrate-binding domain-containing protein [Thiolinea sp.]
MNNLTFKQLRVFQELMRSGSLAMAARNLHRTQPAVSIMLSNLEKELGFDLFERRNRRLIPKPEAQYMLEEVDAVLGRLQRSVRTMQEVAGLQRGQLKIACMPASSLLLAHLVGRFAADKPALQISLMTRSSVVIADWIASQQYDIGLAEAPTERTAIHCETFALPCLCALPVDDPLAQEAVITPQLLDNKPMAVLYPEHTTTQQVKTCFADAGVTFNGRFELQTVLPGLELVAQKLAYSICDPITVQGYLTTASRNAVPPIVFKPFAPEIILEVGLLTPAHRPVSLLGEELCESLRGALKGLQSAS